MKISYCFISFFAVWFVCTGVVQGATCTLTNGAWDNEPQDGDDIVIVSGDTTWTSAMTTNVASWTQSAGTVLFLRTVPHYAFSHV